MVFTPQTFKTTKFQKMARIIQVNYIFSDPNQKYNHHELLLEYDPHHHNNHYNHHLDYLLLQYKPGPAKPFGRAKDKTYTNETPFHNLSMEI